ncbi:MAG: DNA primase [Desulfobacterales bacterium]|nr:DNA primase [Desulfobacterales bacterium]
MAIFIPEDKLSEIKNAADIVDIISEEVVLKKTGRNFLGLCPFHSEKTPSFSVSPDKQIFYCFGCATGGNVFSFLMKQHGLSFPEAAKNLAQRYGIEISTQTLSPEQKRRLNERDAILSANRAATEYFQKTLNDHPEAKKARSYLNKRRISQEIIERFRLGYAPTSWEGLVGLFSKKRIPQAVTVKTGLIIPRKNKNGYYDRFRGRIMFPIFDMSAQVIALGGRVMDDSMPKYMNSPETPVYSKGRSLYGIHLARNQCREANSVYIVEGYFDLLALHQHGIQNTVATLGTALTPEHVRILKGFVGTEGRVVLVYDSDEAGLKAALRSIEIFDKGYVNAQILVLPAGHDPDSYIFESGVEGFVAAAARAKGILSFLIDSAVAKHDLTIDGKLRIIAELQRPLAAIQDSVDRSLYVKELAERIGIDEGAILEKIKDKTEPDKIKKSSEHSFNKEMVSAQAPSKRIEQRVIAMMLQFPSILPEIRARDLIERFDDDILKSIGRTILELSGHHKVQASEMISLIDKKENESIIASLAMEDIGWGQEGALKLIHQFEAGKSRRGQGVIDKQIKAAEAEGDVGRVNQLLKKKHIVAKKLVK